MLFFGWTHRRSSRMVSSHGAVFTVKKPLREFWHIWACYEPGGSSFPLPPRILEVIIRKNAEPGRNNSNDRQRERVRSYTEMLRSPKAGGDVVSDAASTSHGIYLISAARRLLRRNLWCHLQGLADILKVAKNYGNSFFGLSDIRKNILVMCHFRVDTVKFKIGIAVETIPDKLTYYTIAPPCLSWY